MIILCGLFCAGKSTIGARLAEKMALPFYDTDLLIEHREGKTVSELWNELGEARFRVVESEVIQSLKSTPSVVATGGGTLTERSNRDYLKQRGHMIYLKATLPVLWARLQKRGLPAYLDQKEPFIQIERLAEQRFPIFEKFCSYIFETEKYKLDESVTRLHAYLENHISM